MRTLDSASGTVPKSAQFREISCVPVDFSDHRPLLFLAAPPPIFPRRTRAFSFFSSMLLGIALPYVVVTHAFFSDEDMLSRQRVGTGEWIPDIRFEKKKDCILLKSALPGAVFYYEFSRDGNPRDGGEVFDGACIKLPKKNRQKEHGVVWIQAQAFHPENDAWKSGVIEKKFRGENEENKDHEKEDVSLEDSKENSSSEDNFEEEAGKDEENKKDEMGDLPHESDDIRSNAGGDDCDDKGMDRSEASVQGGCAKDESWLSDGEDDHEIETRNGNNVNDLDKGDIL